MDYRQKTIMDSGGFVLLAEGCYGIPGAELIQAAGIDIGGADLEGIVAEALNQI